MCNLQSEGRLSLSKPVNLVIPADLFSEWDKDIASNILKKNEVLPQVVQRNGIMNLLHKLN